MTFPTDYTEELGEHICRLIATNAMGLERIIAKYDLPGKSTIYDWLARHPAFFDSYMEAKRMQAHVLVDEMLDIPDAIPKMIDKDGNERIDSGLLGQAKLKIDTIKWSAERLAPKFFDKVLDVRIESEEEKELLKQAQDLRNDLDKKNKRDY